MSKRFGSKRTGRRRALAGYKSKTQVIAKNEAKKIVKANISRAIEKKRWDGQDVYQLIDDTTGMIVSLYTDPFGAAALGTGAGGQGAVGDVITPTHVYIRLGISVNQTSGANAIVRAIVIQSRGTWPAPVISDILQSTAGGGVLSEFDQENVVGKSGRFRILADRHYVVTTASAPQLMYRTIKINKSKLIKTKFASGTPISITDGNIYLLLVSDRNGSYPEVKYYSSIRYMDA